MTAAEYNNSVDAHSDGLFRFINKSLRDRDESQNVVQDAFENLWINREKVIFEKCRSWLFTTGYRKMIDHIRKQKHTISMGDNFREPVREANHQPDIRLVINNALSKLPEIQRSVIMLRDYEGYDYKEIGEITGLNEAQVKVYIFRARQTMKNYIVSLEAVI